MLWISLYVENVFMDTYMMCIQPQIGMVLKIETYEHKIIEIKYNLENHNLDVYCINIF